MRPIICIFLLILFSCNSKEQKKEQANSSGEKIYDVSLIVLGTLQDGGSPHIGCKKKCCEKLFSNPDETRKVVSLGIVDPENKINFLIEATPDLTKQLRILKNYSSFKNNDAPDGIFLTHAHIGHYAGLMYLGKEAMNADSVKVYTMPRMKNFLENNGPWSQLVKLKNIKLWGMQETEKIRLSNSITIAPFLVPHRDEFSETVGYKIDGPHKKILFIPDIDKWSKWTRNIVEEIKKVDYAFIDGTFFDGDELQNRSIEEIPHPFVIESMELFKALSPEEKNKIYFIHFNHTNPLLDSTSKQTKQVIAKGFHIAEIGSVFSL